MAGGATSVVSCIFFQGMVLEFDLPDVACLPLPLPLLLCTALSLVSLLPLHPLPLPLLLCTTLSLVSLLPLHPLPLPLLLLPG